MRRIIFSTFLFLATVSAAFAQSAPSFTYGFVPTTAEWTSYFAGKQDFLGAPPLLTTGGTMTGPLNIAASTTATAGINLAPGSAPTSPNNGDLWTTAGGMFVQINGATVGPIAGSSSGSFAATLPLGVSFPLGVTTYALNFNSSLVKDGGNNLGINLANANTFNATQTFPNNSLTLAEFPTIAASTVLGSIAGGTPAELSQAQLTSLVNLATALLPGGVPAWPNNTTTYFRGDGNYASLPVGTNAATGIVQCDGTTITCTAGVITSIGSATTSIAPLTTTVSGGVAGDVLSVTSTGCGSGSPCLAQQIITAILDAACSLSPTTCNSFFGYMKPEWYGALHNGTFDDSVPIRAAMSALNSIGRGTLQLSSVTYNMASVGANSSAVNNYPGVDIVGNGPTSILRLANGVITSSATFVNMIYPPGTTSGQAVSNATYRNFTIDMNGANNSCSGTCYSSNVMLGAQYGDNITVDNVTLENNPGSQGFSFGSTASAFPTLTDVTIINSHVSNMCDAVNAACTDSSSLWIHVENGTVANNTFQNCGASKGTAIELHGFNVGASTNAIWNCNVGIIMSSDTGVVATNSSGLTAANNAMNLVNLGVSLQIVTGTTSLTYTIANNAIQMNGVAGVIAGIDAGTNVSATATTGTLNITGNTITSNLTGTIANANFFSGIVVAYWDAANISDNIIKNIGGPGIYFLGGVTASKSIYNVNNNTMQDVGRLTTPTALQSGILFGGTSTAGVLNVQSNTIKNTSTLYAINGVYGTMNASGGLVAGNVVNNVTTPTTWTGTGVGIGQVCSGSPTASFATSSGGIVTHC